ncbi:MAG: 30S ribosomal protein S21 [Dehalococcoidales bacterium]|nr:30S ribosomal protein S21 [Dehalococcoidales bacterium]MDP6127768.1 30S ribosomal protein S21 [Dehalococcoidales bacterium]MDP6501008.1 30S ribosomal protein S21 [Dehalococcoidales bacterium]MDP7525318.1 30S ribosomal protein S21 [Dehalococcoidales bacterium]
MTGVRAGKDESFESLLKRFTRRVNQAGIISEVRHGGYFEKPSVKRNRKETARKRKHTKGPTP